MLRRNGRQTVLNKFYYPIQYLEKNKNWDASETLEDADDGSSYCGCAYIERESGSSSLCVFKLLIYLDSSKVSG